MKQIKCDSAGVAFSLNIKNNDYDEAIINSNFGLGETVVQGVITPDCFIINKLNKKIIDQKLGSKKKIISIEINENKAKLKENENNENKNKYSLNEDQILLIINNLINIENLFKCPVDIEFGFENNILYILQARPITTYNKIPDEFLTLPKEKKYLYFDEILGLQGIENNISILGAEFFYFKMRYNIKTNQYHPDPKTSNLFPYYERTFQNITNLLITISKENFVEKLVLCNSFIKEVILKYGDQYENKSKYKISKIYENVKALGLIVWYGNLKALANPNKYTEQILKNFKEDFPILLSKIKGYCDDALKLGKYSFKALSEKIFYDYGNYLLIVS